MTEKRFYPKVYFNLTLEKSNRLRELDLKNFYEKLDENEKKERATLLEENQFNKFQNIFFDGNNEPYKLKIR